MASFWNHLGPRSDPSMIRILKSGSMFLSWLQHNWPTQQTWKNRWGFINQTGKQLQNNLYNAPGCFIKSPLKHSKSAVLCIKIAEMISTFHLACKNLSNDHLYCPVKLLQTKYGTGCNITIGISSSVLYQHDFTWSCPSIILKNI